jgi:hypothetical protein
LMGVNLRGPFQPPDSTAPSTGDYHVDVSKPSCLDRPFSVELGDVEVNTQIHKVLARGAHPNLGAGPSPLGEGVNSTRVSLLTFTFDSLVCLISHSAHVHL